MSVVGFLSPAAANSDPVPGVCRKFNLVPNVLILVLLLISVIESLIIFNCVLPLKLII